MFLVLFVLFISFPGIFFFWCGLMMMRFDPPGTLLLFFQLLVCNATVPTFYST